MCLADMLRVAHATAANNVIESISNGAIHAVAPAYADFINKPILDLSSEDSRRKINDKDGFRAKANPSQQVRLNLEDDFRKYMVDADFRTTVNALVDNPLEQIWSDVVVLDLSDTQVKDITPLAGLKKLQWLFLMNAASVLVSALMAPLLMVSMMLLAATARRPRSVSARHTAKQSIVTAAS